MDLTKMLFQLRSEREQIEQAILVLENLAKSGGKRRGRPPKWMAEARRADVAVEPPKRRTAKSKVSALG
jgi:hypothetical protein